MVMIMIIIIYFDLLEGSGAVVGPGDPPRREKMLEKP